MQDKLNFYHYIAGMVDVVAVGGSIALLVQNDPTVPSDYVPGDIDLCIASEEDMQIIHENMIADGYVMSLNIDNPYMFTVRRQYKRDGEKHDFFILAGVAKLSSIIEGVCYIHPSVVWAARGFYAGVGSSKAFGQLVDGGYITNTPKPMMSLKSKIKRIIKDLKFLLA